MISGDDSNRLDPDARLIKFYFNTKDFLLCDNSAVNTIHTIKLDGYTWLHDLIYTSQWLFFHEGSAAILRPP
jgi:hypothetical protein